MFWLIVLLGMLSLHRGKILEGLVSTKPKVTVYSRHKQTSREFMNYPLISLLKLKHDTEVR